MENKFTLVITSGNPEDKLNKAILKETLASLKKAKKDVKLIDLHKDKFYPGFEKENLALYAKAESKDKNVIKYQKLLKEADELIFIYETKLGNVSSMMKGFIDKTLLANGFWTAKRLMGMDITVGLMSWINRAIGFTYEKDNYSFESKIAITQMEKGILKTLGIKNSKVYMLSNANDKEARKAYLSKIKEKI